MKLATFNVLFGGEDRLSAICEYVRAIDPDVLVLQECLQWDANDRLGDVAAAMGVEPGPHHAVLGLANRRPSGRQFHVALLSRVPLVQHRVHTHRLAHCLVEAELQLPGERFTILGTHLISRDQQARRAEIEELARLVPSSELATGNYLLLGDLNAFCRLDPYPDDLDEQLQRTGIHKYGHPPSFGELDRLLGHGWVDALSRRAPGTPWVTARRSGHGHTVETRTDYALLSRPLAERLVAAEILDIGDCSDHNPVIVTLANGASSGKMR